MLQITSLLSQVQTVNDCDDSAPMLNTHSELWQQAGPELDTGFLELNLYWRKKTIVFKIW